MIELHSLLVTLAPLRLNAAASLPCSAVFEPICKQPRKRTHSTMLTAHIASSAYPALVQLMIYSWYAARRNVVLGFNQVAAGEEEEDNTAKRPHVHSHSANELVV